MLLWLTMIKRKDKAENTSLKPTNALNSILKTIKNVADWLSKLKEAKS